MNGGPGIAQPFQGRHIIQELCHRELVKQPEVLWKIAESGFQLPLLLLQWAAVYQDASLCRHQCGHQQLHQCGFSCAVRTQEPDQTGGLQRKIDLVQRLFSAGIGHTQILKFHLHRLASFLSGFQKEATRPIWRAFGGIVCFL